MYRTLCNAAEVYTASTRTRTHPVLFLESCLKLLKFRTAQKASVNKTKPVTRKGPPPPAARAGSQGLPRRLPPRPAERCRPAGRCCHPPGERRSAPAAPPGTGENPLPGGRFAPFLARIFFVLQPLKARTVLKGAAGLYSTSGVPKS